MYTACTWKFSQAIQIPFVSNISKYFIYAAYVGWCFVFITMIRSMIKAVSAKEGTAAQPQAAPAAKS
jgi:TRAP-type C4-dicarboxylate transport system permease small subunit